MSIGPGEIATASLFCMMLAMGMGLRPDDFQRVLREPRSFLFGVVGQMMLLPLAAFGIAFVLDLSPALAIGLILIAACPGGATSNALCQYARGDVALSISLTAVSSLASFLSVPFLVGLALGAFAEADSGDGSAISLSFVDTALRLSTSTALPILLGMAVLRWRPVAAARVRGPVLGIATAIVLMLVVGLGFALTGSEASRLLVSAGPAVLLLIATMYAIAVAGGRALCVSPVVQRTVAIEFAIQNFNLAMVIALSLLNERLYLGTALIYLPAMLLAGGGMILASRPRGAQLESSASSETIG